LKQSKRLNGCINVEASGGLGNQLFIYTAGRYLAEKFDCELQIDLGPVGLSGQKHGILIDKLGLGGKFYSSTPSLKKYKKIVFRIIYFISRNFEFGRKFINLFGKYYYAKDVGFDDVLERSSRGKTIRGYFQTWKYFEPISSHLRNEIKLSNPSPWFKELEIIFLETKPIVLHIRLGDYLTVGGKFGVLHSDYYLEAITLITKQLRNKEIWVFSDDIELAKQIFKETVNTNLKWASPSSDSSAEESLLLMSLGSGIIIGNSTFSWWAAMLNKNEPTVVAPKNWFKGAATPRDLFPPNWHLIENSWN